MSDERDRDAWLEGDPLLLLARAEQAERERDAARRAIGKGQDEIAMYGRIAERAESPERKRAEQAEAALREAKEQIAWTVQRCNAAMGDGFSGTPNSAVAAVCDVLLALRAEPTPEEIEAAAKAIWEGENGEWERYERCYSWEIAWQNDDGKEALRQAKAALTAARQSKTGTKGEGS